MSLSGEGPVRADRTGRLDRAALARALAQRIELDTASGWRPPMRAAQCTPQAAPPSPSKGDLSAPLSPRVSAPASGLLSGVSPTEERPAEPPTDGARAGGSASTRGAALLEPLRAQVAECTACGLCQKRTQTVFGVGAADARLFFVGEGPGSEEDRLGEPFVGPAGQLLDKIIGAMGFERSSVYIANVVKCRPPGNRNPEPTEVGACMPYLERQIEAIAPDVMVALGAVAARTLLETESPVGRLRGRFHDYGGTPVRVTYHPAYLLRNPAEKRKVWEDMQAVMARLSDLPDRHA